MKIKNGLLEGVHYIPSPHFNERPNSQNISLLVIHNISLPPGQFGDEYIEDFFQGKLDCAIHPYFETIKDLKVSSHILIKRDGSIIQFVPFDKRAWHAGVSSFEGVEQCNDYGIGIELEGTDDIPYEAVQYSVLVDLSKAIMKAYPLITSSRIAGHNQISPGRKTDPGVAFDWKYYFKLLFGWL